MNPGPPERRKKKRFDATDPSTWGNDTAEAEFEAMRRRHEAIRNGESYRERVRKRIAELSEIPGE